MVRLGFGLLAVPVLAARVQMHDPPMREQMDEHGQHVHEQMDEHGQHVREQMDEHGQHVREQMDEHGQHVREQMDEHGHPIRAHLDEPSFAQLDEHQHLSQNNSFIFGAPCYRRRNFDAVVGHKALIISTSHSKLGDEDCESCDPTGVYAEELTTPYYTFKDAGMEVTIASMQGGVVPISGSSARIASDRRFDQDPQAQEDVHNAPSVSDVNFNDYDIIFMAGGWGAAWDLGASDVLAAKISEAYANPAQFLGSVCHGVLGFIRATKPDGSLLCEGLHMTGVSNRQIEQFSIAEITPMHPEEELNRAGAIYEADHGMVIDFFQNHIVIEGNIVTGQNQQASCQVPQELMTKLQSRLAEASSGGV